MTTAAAPEVLSLAHGADCCSVIPEIGGSIGAWTINGQAMLRRASASSIAARDPLGMASFPLVPYSNRIAHGEFEWKGRRVRLEQNFPPEPYSIHGVGYRRPWRVDALTKDSVELALSHLPDPDWPWAFEARQRIRLREGLLQLDLRVANLADHPAPLGFGHHPYFPKRGARLTFRSEGVWLVDRGGLPTERVAPSGAYDYSRGLHVEHQQIDNCFSEWSGSAHVEWDGQPLALEIIGSQDLPHAVVYSSAELEDFCFEPVPHVNNAINRPDQRSHMPIVEPGEAFSASIRFRSRPR